MSVLNRVVYYLLDDLLTMIAVRALRTFLAVVQYLARVRCFPPISFHPFLAASDAAVMTSSGSGTGILVKKSTLEATHAQCQVS